MNTLFEPIEIYQGEDYKITVEFASIVTEVSIIYRNSDGVLKEIEVDDISNGNEGDEFSFILERETTESARTDVYDLVIHYVENSLKQIVKIENYLKILEYED